MKKYILIENHSIKIMLIVALVGFTGCSTKSSSSTDTNRTQNIDNNDSVVDINETSPLVIDEKIDTDGDGIVNSKDTDDDNDGVLDVNDAFPLDASKSSVPNDGFDNNVRRPVLSNPTIKTLSRDKNVATSEGYGSCAAGKMHWLILEDTKDYIIKMEKDSASLIYPIIIQGGRKVLIQGLSIELEVQPGTEAGTRVMSNGKRTIHPRTVICRAVGLSPKDSEYFIEGALIDLKGHDGDAITTNGTEQSKLTVVNSLIKGVESDDDLHGDILQTQGGAMKNITFENITMLQSSEGMVTSFPVETFNMRNINYKSDARYNADDALDHQEGGFFADGTNYGTPQVNAFSVENMYITYFHGQEQWFMIAGHHFTSASVAGKEIYGVVTEVHPQIHFFQPESDFVTPDKVGLNYTIPEILTNF